MDYEKEYKEAIARIQKYTKDEYGCTRLKPEDIFPELTESEDERIMKDLLGYLHTLPNHFSHNGSLVTEWIAWLKKQGKQKCFEMKSAEESLGISSEEYNKIVDECIYGEQKPADKVKPKFKVSDWIINRTDATIMQIVNNKDFYESVEIGGQRRTDTYNYIEWDFRLWTIQDAKAGDVLADGNLPFIFKKIDSNLHSYAYCGISVDDGFKIESEGESGEWTWMHDIKPATKEQRDLLFQKMKENGYEWDDEKKELKKIEQKPDDVEPIVIRDFNSVFSREQVEEIDKRIEKSQRLYNAKLRDAMQKAKDFPMTD